MDILSSRTSAFPSAGRRTGESIAPVAHERGLVSLPLAGGACQVADHRGESNLRFLLGCEEHLLLEDSILEEKRAAEGRHTGRRPSGRVHTSSKQCMRTPYSLHITKCFSEDGTLDAWKLIFRNLLFELLTTRKYTTIVFKCAHISAQMF